MNHSINKACQLAVALASMLFAFSSCQKEGADIAGQAPKVVTQANFSMSVEGLGASTKASLAENTVNWEVGDKIVMASNGQINGTLSCESVDGAGNATFSGTIANFTPAGVNLFYLANNVPDVIEPEFSLDKQGYDPYLYLYLKGLNIELIKKEENVFEPSSPVTMSGVLALLDLTLDPAGSPASTSGVHSKSVEIIGLKNAFKINLLDGTLEPTFIQKGGHDIERTHLYSSSEEDNHCRFFVVPQNAQNLTIWVEYSNGMETMWRNINWNITSEMAGKTISTVWTGDGKVPEILTNRKQGYSPINYN